MNQLGLAIIMFVAGIGIPVMAALNAGLSQRVESPFGAVFLMCVLSVIVTAGFVMFHGRPSLQGLAQIPIYYYLGFIPFLIYICGITIIAPKIGLGTAVFLVLFGQLFSATVIDHFALFGAPESPITMKRALGLVLMAAGMFLVQGGPVSQGSGGASS